MKIAAVGHMGRDEALFGNLLEGGHQLHILGQWENPGLVDKAKASGGDFQTIGSIKDVAGIADYIEARQPDMFLTNFDDTLAAGVVDTIRERQAAGTIHGELLLPCPDKEASRIEWDKFLLREVINEIDPKYNPTTFLIDKDMSPLDAIAYFEDQDKPFVVKPRNLTGGKGVKVMGKHFDTYEEGRKYALDVLANDSQEGLEIQELMEGEEFTLQVFTDGDTMVRPPVTMDFPYRDDGDTGGGTGGMGTITMKDGLLPFVTEADYNEAMELTGKILEKLKERGIDYKGMIYPSFFKTKDGELKIIEVNARGGDPELVNIVDLMEEGVDVGRVLKLIAEGNLAEDSVRYKKLASTLKYLVAPEYARIPTPEPAPVYEFSIDPAVLADYGVRMRFAAAERVNGNRYRTKGLSRAVALIALAETPWAARAQIHGAMEEGFDHMPLDHRLDIGKRAHIKSLAA